jgi:hypothetical protein
MLHGLLERLFVATVGVATEISSEPPLNVTLQDCIQTLEQREAGFDVVVV